MRRCGDASILAATVTAVELFDVIEFRLLVGENERGIIERNAVFLEVPLRLDLVPLEVLVQAHRTPRRFPGYTTDYGSIQGGWGGYIGSGVPSPPLSLILFLQPFDRPRVAHLLRADAAVVELEAPLLRRAFLLGDQLEFAAVFRDRCSVYAAQARLRVGFAALGVDRLHADFARTGLRRHETSGYSGMKQRSRQAIGPPAP